jgi:predicted RNA-binding Zn ribbon-like protein
MTPIAELERVSGDLALDFLNTIEDRDGPQRRDFLSGPGELAEWGAAAGLIDAGAAAPDPDAEFATALELRDRITAILAARLAGRDPAPRDLSGLAGAVAAAHSEGTLVPDDEGRVRWRWDPSEMASVRHSVATAAYDLLASPAAARIGECDGPACGWFFLDTSKRGNRRWCSMRECGQDAKSAQRRASRRG